jgi:hypothetical protein
MKRLDSGGFSVVEVLIVFVALVIISGAGFYVYNTSKRNTESTQADKSQQSMDTKSTSVAQEPMYTNVEDGYSFDYPSDWKVTDTANEQGTAPGMPKRHSITLQSPDFAESTNGHSDFLVSGASMVVKAEPTQSTTVAEAVDSNTFLASTLSMRVDGQSLDGVSAIQYRHLYDMSFSLSTVAVKNAKLYTVSLQYAGSDYADETFLKRYQKDYDALLESFRFTK